MWNYATVPIFKKIKEKSIILELFSKNVVIIKENSGTFYYAI